MKNSPVLSYLGVNIYNSFKGDRALFFGYALSPEFQAEDHITGHIDVRALPEECRKGLELEAKNLDDRHKAHIEALRRAIDAGYITTDGLAF